MENNRAAKASASFLAALAQMLTVAARMAYRGLEEPDAKKLIAANELMAVVSSKMAGVAAGSGSYTPDAFFQVLREKAARHFAKELEWAITSALASTEGRRSPNPS